jgi:hypothetical protein
VNKHFCVLFLLFPVLALFSQVTEVEFLPYEYKIPNSNVSFKMIPIKGGSFLYGSPETETGRQITEGPRRSIQINSFWMEEHEVTYDEFLIFFNDENTSRNSEYDAITRPTPQYIDLSWGMGKQGGFPVNSMSQHTAMMYCRWLYKQTGLFYRLPSEAEWEYACRAGSNSAYHFGNDPKILKDYGWFSGSTKNKYQKVMQKKPNDWGLFDMHGNVAEWTLDQYDANFYTGLKDGEVNPINMPTKRYPRSVKGGGFMDDADKLRSASRSGSEPSWNKRDPQIPKSIWWLTDGQEVGFRLVRPLVAPSTEEIVIFYDKFTKEG